MIKTGSLIKKMVVCGMVLAFFSFPFLVPPIVIAATTTPTYAPLEPDVFVGFGDGKVETLEEFLSMSFQFGLALAVALTVIMIVWGGVEVMLSESVLAKDAGKKRIEGAIIGLGLALVSWLILYTINPDILIFKI